MRGPSQNPKSRRLAYEQKMKKVAVFNDTSPGGHFGCYAVMSVLDQNLRKNGLEPVVYWPCGVDWRPYSAFFRSLDLDLVVVNAEGSIHNSKYRPRAQYLSQIGHFSREVLKCPSVIINGTFHNLDQFAVSNLTHFDLVFTREKASANYLKRKSISSLVVPDLSFFSNNFAVDTEKTDAPLVTDSTLSDVTKKLDLWSDKNNLNFEAMRPAKSQKLISQRILNNLFSIGNKFQEPIRRIRQKPKVATEIKRNAAFQEFLGKLSRAEGVFTGRLHTLTLALSVRTPVLAVPSNTPKIESVLLDIFGNKDRCLNISGKEPDQVFADWSNSMQFSCIEERALKEYLDWGACEMREMFLKISVLTKRK